MNQIIDITETTTTSFDSRWQPLNQVQDTYIIDGSGNMVRTKELLITNLNYDGLGNATRQNITTSGLLYDRSKLRRDNQPSFRRKP